MPAGLKTLDVPALKAGTFAFHCKIDPGAMSGTFVVKCSYMCRPPRPATSFQGPLGQAAVGPSLRVDRHGGGQVGGTRMAHRCVLRVSPE